ncbi:MAG: tyrosine-protein phosphatase, partial [Erysipelotrichaceae bacterium]|nr:tyrosine-protein phosphatase [Erysipelotrichaceae bacterium]
MIEIHLDSIGNIRDLGDYQTSDGKTIRPNKLIRSAHLGRASREDLDYLKEKHGLSTVIDLRTYKEKEEVPDQTDTLVYRHIPIIEGFEDGITHEKKKTFKMPFLKDTY